MNRGMLRSTFMHIPGVGPKTEREFWAAGVTDWDAFDGGAALTLTASRRRAIHDVLAESDEQLSRRNAAFFADRMPAGEQWRLFDAFRDHTAYLDIPLQPAW